MSDAELKPCECGEDINEYFRIRHVFNNYSPDSLFVCYCDFCGKFEPFKTRYSEIDEEINTAAYNAWNNTSTNANELIEKIKGQSYRLAGACHDVVSVKDVIEAIKGIDK